MSCTAAHTMATTAGANATGTASSKGRDKNGRKDARAGLRTQPSGMQRTLWALARILGRFLGSLFVASIAIFALLRLIPGDPAEIALGVSATPDLVAELQERLGTNRPVHEQYLHWLGAALTGDFGVSMTSGQDISPLLFDRAQVSFILCMVAMFCSLLVAVPMGLWAAQRARRFDGLVISTASQIGIAVPSFLAAVLLVAVFAVHLGWVPANGWTPPGVDFKAFVERLILPVVSLTAVQAAILTRYVRGAILEVLHEDFMRTAFSKGMSSRRAVLVHALRNAALPVLTVTGTQLTSLIVGAVVIERVFMLPGIGSMLLDAVVNRDLPVVQAVVMVLVFFTLAVNLLVDILNTLVDPRTRR